MAMADQFPSKWVMELWWMSSAAANDIIGHGRMTTKLKAMMESVQNPYSFGGARCK